MDIRLLGKEDISKAVCIHRNCVCKTNSLSYPADVIDEWLSQITAKSVQNQLNNFDWYVVRDGVVVVGFCQYSLEDGELYQIQIDPDYQGRGYGKSLYDFVENDFKKHGKTKITLNSTLNAVPFYEKMGFKRVKDITFPLRDKSIKMVLMEKIKL